MVAESEQGMTAPEIAKAAGIDVQATRRILHTISGDDDAGLLTRVDSRYVLSLRAFIIASSYDRQLSLPERLMPLVRSLSARTDETAYAAGWHHGEITAFARRTRHPRRPSQRTPQGYTANAHARASGKLLLAYATETVRDDYLDTHPLDPVTPHTITDRAQLEQELQLTRDQGYAMDNEEFALGLRCVAVPFYAGHAPFALALSARKDRFQEHFEEYLSLMRHMTGSE